MRRTYLTMAGFVIVAALLAGSPAEVRAGGDWPDVIALPDGWLPEGVVVGRTPVIYSGSRANGAIYAANLRTGEGGIVVPGAAGRVSVGLSFDRRSNYIFAAGGATGKGFVYDADTGALVQEYAFRSPGGFVNDVIVTRDAAYFTQSQAAEYYRVPLGPAGEPGGPADFDTIVLSGDWQQLAGTNANGIEATPNGKDLIIVNTAAGALYRVDPLSGEATRIDLGGESVSFGDGLLLLGQTIYVVRNRLNQIAVIEFASDLASGTLVETLTHPAFDVPTTIAPFGNAIYAVNARFGTPPTPSTPYSIVRVTAKP